MLRLEVAFPDHQETLAWLESRDVKPDKLETLVQNVCMKMEEQLKQTVISDTKDATGLTAASVESWLVERSSERITYKVGSRTRGHIIRWLDRGRGWVYPVKTRALWIKKGRVTPPIFRAWARPSPALNVLWRAASLVWSNIQQTIREVIEK